MNDQVVLDAIAALGDAAYGVTILREVETRRGRSSSLGALYVALDRLEAAGLVTSYEADPTPERGNRPKRYFKLTQAVEDL